MDSSSKIRLAVTRAEGAAPELVEESARSLLQQLNETQPGSAGFGSIPADQGDKQAFQQTLELVVGISGVASAWLVPAIQHWLRDQAADTGLVFKSGDYEVQIKGNAPAEMFAKISQAIAQATKA